MLYVNNLIIIISIAILYIAQYLPKYFYDHAQTFINYLKSDELQDILPHIIKPMSCLNASTAK